MLPELQYNEDEVTLVRGELLLGEAGRSPLPKPQPPSGTIPILEPAGSTIAMEQPDGGGHQTPAWEDKVEVTSVRAILADGSRDDRQLLRDLLARKPGVITDPGSYTSSGSAQAAIETPQLPELTDEESGMRLAHDGDHGDEQSEAPVTDRRPPMQRQLDDPRRTVIGLAPPSLSLLASRQSPPSNSQPNSASVQPATDVEPCREAMAADDSVQILPIIAVSPSSGDSAAPSPEPQVHAHQAAPIGPSPLIAAAPETSDSTPPPTWREPVVAAVPMWDPAANLPPGAAIAPTTRSSRRRTAVAAVLSALLVLIGGLIAALVLAKRPATARVQLWSDTGVALQDAEVYVDDELRCEQVPCEIRDLEAGKQRFKLIAPGFVPNEQTVRLDDGEDRRLSVTLQPKRN